MSVLLGFLGGLVAVALKGYVDFYLERRRENRAGRAAARLLADAFIHISIDASIVREQNHLGHGQARL